MLDTKCTLVLKILQSQCKNGSYKIIEKNDVISSLPSKYRCDEDELNNIFSYLERKDCICIKYDDDDVCCLCLLPSAKDFLETKEKKKDFSFLIFFILFLGTFIASFLGSFLQKFILD